MNPSRAASLTALLLVAVLSSRAYVYVDLAPTMGKIIGDAKNISVVKVTEFDRQKRIVILFEIKVLKG